MENKKILIVDDDPDIRQGMQVRLKANHYDTFFAADALEAIAEARNHKPDLIILDLGLTAGDGFTVIERLKQVLFLARIPIVVVSARDSNPNRARALEAGAKAFLQKPVEDAELLSVIRKALGEPEQRPKPTLHDGGEATKTMEGLGRGAQGCVLNGGQSDSSIRTMQDAMDRRRLIADREPGTRQLTNDNEPLSAHLSHDVRNAFSCIFQFGNILMGGLAGELSEEQRQYLGIMLENASHIRSVLLPEATPAGLGECANHNGPLAKKAT